MNTLLFFDDTWLTRREGLTRRLGKPRMIPDSVYSDPEGIIGMGVVSVHYDEASGRYMMFYPAFYHDPDCGHLFYNKVVSSTDGLHWEPVDTRPYADIPERYSVAQMFDTKEVNELASVYKDPVAPAEERYKAFTIRRDEPNHRLINELWHSPDALTWTKREGVRWHPVGAEPGTHVLYNPVRKCHTILLRPDWAERRVAVVETTDYENYSPMLLTMQADSEDEPLSEIYGMPAFWYGEYCIAMPWLFHTSYDEHFNKFWKGAMNACLAYSMNGVTFQRCMHRPFMDNGEPGEPDCGCVLPQSVHVQPDGSLRIYAFARTIEHGSWRMENVSAICAYSLRRDGFVFLETKHGPGTLRTRALCYEGGKFEVNVSSTFGVTCALYSQETHEVIEGFGHEQCKPFIGDSDAWTPQWENANIEDLAGTIFYAELRINTGRLYAIRGNFIQLSSAAAKRYQMIGVLPERYGM